MPFVHEDPPPWLDAALAAVGDTSRYKVVPFEDGHLSIVPRTEAEFLEAVAVAVGRAVELHHRLVPIVYWVKEKGDR